MNAPVESCFLCFIFLMLGLEMPRKDYAGFIRRFLPLLGLHHPNRCQDAVRIRVKVKLGADLISISQQGRINKALVTRT